MEDNDWVNAVVVVSVAVLVALAAGDDGVGDMAEVDGGTEEDYVASWSSRVEVPDWVWHGTNQSATFEIFFSYSLVGTLLRHCGVLDDDDDQINLNFVFQVYIYI